MKITLYVLFSEMSCLRMNEIRIPKHIVRENDARLECHFDLEGEALYSVKWYKDGNEFYRYVPRDQPPVQLFTLPGITVDVSVNVNSNFSFGIVVCGSSSFSV